MCIFLYSIFKGISGDLLELAINHRQSLAHILDVSVDESSEGELAAMVSFAIAFPDGFMALVDTYDVKRYFAFRQILSDDVKCILLFVLVFNSSTKK